MRLVAVGRVGVAAAGRWPRPGAWPLAALLLLCCSTVSALPPAPEAAGADDIIARVGDQVITLSEIDVMINSSGMVGIALPPPGTNARNQLRLALLDKAISANLLYLDALGQGLDREPVYRHEVERYAETLLAERYRNRVLIGEIEVSDQEVLERFHKDAVPGATFTKDVGAGIRASIRKERYQKRVETLRQRLRAGSRITIDRAQLDPAHDGQAEDDDIVATVAGRPITRAMLEASSDAPLPAQESGRSERLERLIDRRLMVEKARSDGLDRDPVYRRRLAEFKKVRLIGLHKARLVQRLEPSEREIAEYFEANRDRVAIAEARKIQMVVVSSEEAAERIKRRIGSGEITLYQAAARHSIDPNAKKTLGEIGWVEKGSGFPELDRLAFSLPLNTLGGPVASPAGWHLVKVLDIREPRFLTLDSPGTRKKVRRMVLRDKRNRYVVDLRRTRFTVEVDRDAITRLLEKELQALKPTLGQAVPPAS